MPSSAIRTVTDVDEYRTAASRRACVELTVVQRGSFTASITRIDLHRVWMQRGHESLARIRHAEPHSGRNIISFLTQDGQRTFRNGVEFHPGNIALLSPRRSNRYRSFGPVHWGGMSLPLADMAEISATVAGRDLMPEDDEQIVTPPEGVMAKLQRLHAEAGHLAEHAPEVIANWGAAHGLEQALIEAMVDCLVINDRREDAAACRRHAMIMQRFHAELEANDDDPVYLPDICAKIGVAGRTLRLCCQEHLGMSPKQYLLVRRLHLARRALRQGTPATTVTDTAMRFGFWELGRFAVRYKSLFGEAPSTTLKRNLTTAFSTPTREDRQSTPIDPGPGHAAAGRPTCASISAWI
jgi:AraC-like DNA-binding protein